jgi:hypothetical protein
MGFILSSLLGSFVVVQTTVFLPFVALRRRLARAP